MDAEPPPGVITPSDAARLVDQVRDYAIIALDSSGTIESWNAGAHQLKGYTGDEVIGRSFALLYPDEQRRAGLPLQLLDRARRDGRAEHTGWRLRKDGSLFWGDVVITALHDDLGHLTGFAKMTRDRTENHRLEVSLRRSEERFRLLVGEVRDYAIFALDGSGTIESWNAGAERLKGYTRDEAIGGSSSMFYTEEDRRAGLPVALLAEARAHGSVEQTGWRVRKDGSRFWADVVITALTDGTGEVTGFTKVTRDLTEARRLEEAQRAFYSSFAHDFLTPVTAMHGFAQLLRHAHGTERERYVDRIEENADRLAAMMGNLVDYANHRVTDAPYDPESLGLTELVAATEGQLGSAYAVERVSVVDTGVRVHADRLAMERVLTNLVGNALLYSAAGPVEVSAAAGTDGVEITVSDQGRGIAAEDLPTIFDEFQRGRLASHDGGSGLGLASARRLVEQQGGTITLVSTVDVGTTVTVRLPAGAAVTDVDSGTETETVRGLRIV